MITIGPDKQGTKIYRTEKDKFPCTQEPALRDMKGKHSPGLAVFIKTKKKCYNKYKY
jgi:hypothetical protein